YGSFRSPSTLLESGAGALSLSPPHAQSDSGETHCDQQPSRHVASSAPSQPDDAGPRQHEEPAGRLRSGGRRDKQVGAEHQVVVILEGKVGVDDDRGIDRRRGVRVASARLTAAVDLGVQPKYLEGPGRYAGPQGEGLRHIGIAEVADRVAL